jgi:hypothetical protein
MTSSKPPKPASRPPARQSQDGGSGLGTMVKAVAVPLALLLTSETIAHLRAPAAKAGKSGKAAKAAKAAKAPRARAARAPAKKGGILSAMRRGTLAGGCVTCGGGGKPK